MDTLREEKCIFLIISRSVLLNMRNISRNFVEKIKTRILSYVCCTEHHCDNLRIKHQLNNTYYFTVLLIGSSCFGHYYAHHQELTTMMLITTLVVSFLVCCRLEVRCGLCWSSVRAAACRPDTTPHYLTSNLQQTKNETNNVVINIIVASSR